MIFVLLEPFSAQHMLGNNEGLTVCDAEKINKAYKCRNSNPQRCTDELKSGSESVCKFGLMQAVHM